LAKVIPGNPLVTVVIPAYCRVSFLERAMISVIKQSFADLELLVVHNGPFQEIKTLIDRYIKCDSRIRYIYMKKASAVEARNTGVREARGSYIAFLDDDDEWFPTKLQAQLDLALSNTEIGIVCSDPIVVTKEGEAKAEWIGNGSTDFYHLVMNGIIIRSFSGVLIPKNVLLKIGPIDDRYLVANDYDLYLRISRHYKIAKTSMPLYRYYLHGDNLSGNVAFGFEEVVKILKELEPAPELGVTKKVIDERIRKYYRNFYGAAVNAMDAKRYDDARRFYLKAIVYEPTIGARLEWGRFKNPFYRLLMPYLALGYCIYQQYLKKESVACIER